MVKAKAGMTDDYLKGLAKTFKGAMDEVKKQNLIIDYKILLGEAATPQDFDILLMVESKNMAALDDARESSTRSRKVEGSPDQQRATQRSGSKFARSWAARTCARSRSSNSDRTQSITGANVTNLSVRLLWASKS